MKRILSAKHTRELQKQMNFFETYGYKGPLHKAMGLTKKEVDAWLLFVKSTAPKLVKWMAKNMPKHKMPTNQKIITAPVLRKRAEREQCPVCIGMGVTLDSILKKKLICSACNGKGTVPKRPVVTGLHKHTKLNKEQLKQLERSGGKGQHARFSANGEVNLELIRRVDLARRKGPKYILYSDDLGRRVYVADRELVKLPKDGKPLTFNIKEALVFYEEFDNAEIKAQYFGGLCSIKFLTATLFKKPTTDGRDQKDSKSVA